jgi:hypothetical protein
MTDDVLARLRKEADREFAPAWRPTQPGDEVAGVVTAIRPSVHTSFGPVPVVELDRLDTREPVAVWAVHTVLRNELARQRPVPGETVLVRYLGTVTPDGGGPSYESYRVVVDRLDTPVDWSAIGDEQDPALAGATADTDRTAPTDDIPY